ncbi:PREDICTED: flavin-dependent oxidoreductase FOX5-like [Prunus mume]|uniref:Flavin-dependent oxidoreductase FOX5-like n=1 Tax=Prunus mume TaxID=102107 RepID=A0ABM0NJD8_PRUMU|nr:PREDICTED: flavin-dependent oxidoreductase FOX5-like [Prunus mume]
MKFQNPTVLLFILSVLSISVSWATSATADFDGFLQCLTKHPHSAHPIQETIYTRQNASFQSVLVLHINNRRFSTPTTTKPLAIIAAKNESHVQATVVCAKRHGLQIKIRSGGHDFEGLSYTSDVPFVILDMFNLKSVDVNLAQKRAWVMSGATLGEVYYAIAAKTKVYGFPAGICPTVGAGGHFGGGGYGFMMRKYGLSVDNIVDAKIVTVKGALLDRKSMGEDLFWAIRGGGGASFGVILSWKLKLVPVPAKVTVFNVTRTIEEGVTNLVYKWQTVAPKLPKELFLRAMPQVKNIDTKGKKTVAVSFLGHFLGKSDKVVALLSERFPELGLQRKNCHEVSWVESTVFWADNPIGTPINVLLNKPTEPETFYKGKSDYVKKPLPKPVFESIWKKMIEIENIWLDWNPYGGRMSEISVSATPYPHRAGNLFFALYYSSWYDEGIETTNKYLGLIRELYEMMTPYVSKNPREAFQNYRDLDIGANQDSQTNFETAKLYGKKYFKGNFDRLVRVKTKVDPHNFFKHKQSIPTL